VTILIATATNSTSTINDVEPGLLGFLVVAGLGLALVFLLRSMNKQFKKIGPKPEEAQPDEAGLEEAEPGDAESDGTADEAERPQDAERF
jgi:hypothetical protein